MTVVKQNVSDTTENCEDDNEDHHSKESRRKFDRGEVDAQKFGRRDLPAGGGGNLIYSGGTASQRFMEERKAGNIVSGGVEKFKSLPAELLTGKIEIAHWN